MGDKQTSFFRFFQLTKKSIKNPLNLYL